MSVKSAVTLFIGVVLALAGVAVLIWLLWRLWSKQEREKQLAAVEFEVEPSLPAAKSPAAVPHDVGQPASVALEEEAEAAPVPPPVKAGAVEVDIGLEAEAAAKEAAAPDKVDDLKRIEGIGPKIAAVLREGGVRTFAQLAATEVERIKEILGAADTRLLRLADPDTWPEQASLAATGQWEALEALQNKLKGGRRAQ
jgi:predicted flap endonuclease-1-like 5' DNA nuclease